MRDFIGRRAVGRLRCHGGVVPTFMSILFFSVVILRETILWPTSTSRTSTGRAWFGIDLDGDGPLLVSEDESHVVRQQQLQNEQIKTLEAPVFSSPRDSRLPQWPNQRVTKSSDKILVVYSGPTELVDQEQVRRPKSSIYDRKKELYRVNFEHFLKHGVQCKTQDTLLIVTPEVEPMYREQVHEMNQKCQVDYDKQVLLAVRNNTCLDLETVRRAMHDNLVDIDSYDYYVSANCGTSGPSVKWASLPWTEAFIAPLNSVVKMSGLTLNCGGQPHIQSMVYALDRVGLQIIKNSRTIFDCQKEPHPPTIIESHYIINRYERGMSYLLISNGFGIAPLIKPTVLMENNTTTCRNDSNYRDQWITAKMMEDYGRVLDMEDTIFAKTSRLMSEATKKEINFTLEVNWSW